MKNTTKRTKKQVEPVVERVYTEEEKMTMEVQSLKRLTKTSKENILRNLKQSINTMRSFLEDAERSILRVEKGYDEVEDVARQLVHDFGWGHANAVGSITTAMSYSKEYMKYKTELETMLKYSQLANEVNNKLIAEEVLEKAQAEIVEQERLAAEAKAKEDEVYLNFGSLDKEFIGLNGLGNPIHVINGEKQEVKEGQIVRVEGTDYIVKDNKWQSLLETFLQGALQNKENNL